MAMTLSDGTNNVTINADTETAYQEDPNIVEHVIPERTGSLFQVMGRKSGTIPIEGYTQTSADITQLVSWVRNGTVLTFTDTLHPSYSGGVDVIIMPGFQSKRLPARPSTYFRYVFVLKEWNQ